MEKDFLDELVEGLGDLQERKKITVPVLPLPHEVMKVLIEVASKHNITQDDLRTMLAFRAVPTKEELELIKNSDEK